MSDSESKLKPEVEESMEDEVPADTHAEADVKGDADEELKVDEPQDVVAAKRELGVNPYHLRAWQTILDWAAGRQPAVQRGVFEDFLEVFPTSVCVL